MPLHSSALLERFRRGRPTEIDLTIRAPYRDLLAKLGNPQERLPPVIHVAGTNGKGSTCAFLRAMLEAAGQKVHVYTSPHLMTFHERIRIQGRLIGEEELTEILSQCEQRAEPGSVTYFEASTAAAFVAFARHPADVTLLEVGLGGRLDATNVIPPPRATVITRLSFDHRDYLGDTLTDIAREKTGILRPGVPCFAAPQPAPEARAALEQAAADIGAPLLLGDRDWRVEPCDAATFRFVGPGRDLTLPLPALTGQHQLWNAGLALATVAALPQPLPAAALSRAMQHVDWPARLQRLTHGNLAEQLPPAWELWLDGGHNDSAGEVLAAQFATWRREDGDAPRPLHLIFGMLKTKVPEEFLAPLASHVEKLCAVTLENDPPGFAAAELADLAQKAGIQAIPASGLRAALSKMASPETPPGRLLICGSLYLAGKALKENGTKLR